MGLLCRKTTEVLGATGFDFLESKSHPDVDLLPEISRKRQLLRQLATTAIFGILGTGAYYVISTPFLYPERLPKADTNSAKPNQKDPLLEALNPCRTGQRPCVRITGLLAVKNAGGPNGAAIENPVVIIVNGIAEVVSDNLATDADKKFIAEAWPVDDSLSFCSGSTEPYPELVSLVPNINTARYSTPHTGVYSPKLDMLADKCQTWVETSIVDRALQMYDQQLAPVHA